MFLKTAVLEPIWRKREPFRGPWNQKFLSENNRYWDSLPRDNDWICGRFNEVTLREHIASVTVPSRNGNTIQSFFPKSNPTHFSCKGKPDVSRLQIRLVLFLFWKVTRITRILRFLFLFPLMTGYHKTSLWFAPVTLKIKNDDFGVKMTPLKLKQPYVIYRVVIRLLWHRSMVYTRDFPLNDTKEPLFDWVTTRHKWVYNFSPVIMLDCNKSNEYTYGSK